MRLRLVFALGLLAVAASVVVSPAPVFGAATATAAPERVEVKRGNSWYPATVIKREGTKALVHYEGLSNDFDEWVGPERMREAAVRPTAPPEPREPAPGPAAKEKPQKKEKADENDAAPEIEDEGDEPGAAPKKVTRADYSGAKRLNGDTSTAPERWQLTADPQATPQAKVSMATIALFRENEGPEKSRRFGENIESPLFAGPGVARAVLPRYWSHGGKGRACRLELVDLGVGRSVTLAEMPVDSKVLDFSPDGENVLLYDDKWGNDGHMRLDVFAVGGKKSAHAISWKPYSNEPEDDQQIEWAGFVDATHVLSISEKHKAVLWDWAKAKALYVLQLDQMGAPVLSPGRKYFLIGGSEGFTVHEALTGKLVAYRKDGRLWGSKFHFRPDGKQFAGAGWGKVRVWDFETGKTVGEFVMPPNVGHFGFNWLNADYGLLDGRYLFDVNRGLVLWDYSRRGGMEGGVYAGRYYYMADGSAVFSHVLASVVLPHPAVKLKTANLKPEEYLAVRAGVSVSVEINIEAPPEGREKVVKSIESKLKANGLTIADGQPLKLVATTTPGESRELSYHLFGQPGFGKVTVNEKKLRVAFELDGKAIWEDTNISGAGGMFSLKEGQTVEQAIAERMAGAWHFFENVQIPKQVAKVGEKVGYGASQLTGRGIQEVKDGGDSDEGGQNAPAPGGRQAVPRGNRRLR